jgi:dTDP-L-rhamnose 4-epimerase
VLVTGGAGFIGVRTCRALLARGYHVRAFDRLAAPVHPDRRWPAELPPEVERVEGDVESRADLLRALRGAHAIVHLAAYQDYLPDFSTFLKTNAAGTALLYELIVAERLPIQRVVIASSQSVYGEGSYRCERHGQRFPNARSLDQLRRRDWEISCEDCGHVMEPLPTAELTVNPQNPYGISKLSQELIGIHLGRRYGIPTVALRYSITQGAGQSFHNAYSGICRIFCASALQHRPLPVYEDGRQQRDYVHVEDVVAANLLSLEDRRTDNQVFNVGGSGPTTVLEYAELVREIVGVDVPIEVSGAFRVGDTRHIISDSARLLALGWRRTRSLPEIVREYAEWAAAQTLPPEVAQTAQARMRLLGALAGG